MLTIAICDDMPLHCKRTETVLKRNLTVPADITLFTSSKNLLTAIGDNRYKPELVFLDIDMDELDGIETAKLLNQMLPQCHIIFITSYEQYAPEVYQAEHTWFIPKKKIEEYMGPALKKALSSNITQNRDEIIFIRSEGKCLLLPVNEVLYLERSGRHTSIVTTDWNYISSMHPDNILTPELRVHFIHCHQSYWVNKQFIETLDHDIFIMKNGEHIQLGRTYRLEARQAFFDWLKSNL